ncbi:MAG: GAF domain-containing SpoIIE family protein phosphatase [Acidobacteriota bacterium]
MTEPINFDVLVGPEGSQASKSQRQLLTTLFALGREVASVLDLDELLRKLPELIERITDFHAFAIYLLDEEYGDLKIAYSTGYPPERRNIRLQIGEGLVGSAVQGARPLVANDVASDPRYIEAVPGTRAELVVPLRRKGKVIGALNLLSANVGEFTPDEVETLRNFAAAVGIALENARLFETERQYAATLETLAEIGQEFASILDLDVLLKRIAHHIKRVIDYRTFGILLVDDREGVVEMRHAVRYDERALHKRVKLGEGLVGYAALHKVPVLVPDVSKEPRYINILDDCRSELVIPLLVQDKCVGVFDLESPELNAFTKAHIELLSPLAASAAIAIENARLYDEIRVNEERLEKELRFAQRVQKALLPTALPKRVKHVDAAWRFEPARELGGDLFDFLVLGPHTLTVAVGDVSGKGVPAALYSTFAAELLRSRTYRRRFMQEQSSPAGVLASMNQIMHERRLEEYYCTLAYANFDLKRHIMTLANSGLPYPIQCTEEGCAQIELPGVPLGSLPGITYDEISLDLDVDDIFVFATDGIFEAMNEEGSEFGADRLMAVVRNYRGQPAKALVDAIVAAVETFRGGADQNDDMTVVAIRVTG